MKRKFIDDEDWSNYSGSPSSSSDYEADMEIEEQQEINREAEQFIVSRKARKRPKYHKYHDMDEEIERLQSKLFNQSNNRSEPFKYRILTLNKKFLNDSSKRTIIKMIDSLAEIDKQNDPANFTKHYENLKTLEAVPFGNYIPPMVGLNASQLQIAMATNEFYYKLDSCIFGQRFVKNRLTQIFHNQMTNPDAPPPIIGLEGPPGVGKCLGKGTPVLLFDGTVKKVEQLTVDDILIGDDLMPRNILSLCNGREKLYKIKQEDADDYTVNSSHILTVKDNNGTVIDIKVTDLLKIPDYKNKYYGFRVGKQRRRVREGLRSGGYGGTEVPCSAATKNCKLIGLFGRYKSGETKIAVEEMDEGEYYGFQIDGNGRFLLGDLTVTHNTTLIEKGFALAQNRPFRRRSLNGIGDKTIFKGQLKGYIGASYGWMIECLVSCLCMNPVVFFDELDKIIADKDGDACAALFMEITDQTSNHQFNDDNYPGIDFDISKVSFIFAYNDRYNINPILLDRITTIRMNGYTIDEKLQICKQFIIKEKAEKMGMDVKSIIIGDRILKHIINKYTDEDGVRGLRSVIEQLFLQLNLLRFENIDPTIMGEAYISNIKFPLTVTKKIVDILL